MKKLILASLIFSVGTASAATTIDFESASFSGASFYTESGVTFSVDGATISTAAGPIGGTALSSSPFSTANPFKAVIAGGASSVSVDLGDFTPSDSDNIFLSVYSSSNILLDSINMNCCNIDPEQMFTLSLVASNISYALFGSIGGSFSNSVFADNFTYTSAVPIPAAAFMFAPALLGFMGLRRKAKNSVA